MSKDLVTIGKILKPVGLCGELKVLPLTDFPERFKELGEITIETKEGQHKLCCVDSIRHRPPFVYVTFEKLSSRDMVQFLLGGVLQIPEKERVSLPKGSYFQSELIGIAVYLKNGNLLGTITNIIETGSNDVLVVQKGQAESLIPALKKVVEKIDLQQRRMVIDPPEGLLAL